MKKGASALPWIIFILVVLYLAGAFSNLKLPTFGGGGGGGNYFGQLVSLSTKGLDKLRGSAIGVNAEVFSNLDEPLLTETSIASALTASGTSYPNTFEGYVMMGNDNYESSTDRGSDYYYTKTPIGWTNLQGLTTRQIETYAEEITTGTSLWTFYDDNTAESTANVTIGSGGTYTAASVKLMSSSRNCTGNPYFNGQQPLALCFNESTSGMFKTIKPNKNSGQIGIPGFLSGKNVVSCYAIPQDALCDGAYWTSDLYIEANAGQNPGATDFIGLIPLDKCFYKNDKLVWSTGYGDESDLSADADCGLDSLTMYLPIYNM